MKSLQSIYIVLVLVLASTNLFSQVSQLSQYYDTGQLTVAPSYAGMEGSSVSAVHRNQWVGLPSSFATYMVGAEFDLKNLNSGIGGYMALESQAGLMTTMSFSVQYNYRIQILKDLYYIPGIEFNYYQRRLNIENFMWRDQLRIDGMHNSASASSVVYDENWGAPNFSFSNVFTTKTYWLGFGLKDFMPQPSYYFGEKDMRSFCVAAYGGVKISLDKRNKSKKFVGFSFYYRNWINAQLSQLDANVMYIHPDFSLGLGYRGAPSSGAEISNSDAIIFALGLKFDNFKVNLSYDITVSGLGLVGSNGTGGTPEIGISIPLSEDRDRASGRKGAVLCPLF